MQITANHTGKSNIELKISLGPEDLRPHLVEAAARLSRHLNIPGFRPGKAPFDMVKREVGVEKISQEALDDAINASLLAAMRQENIYPYGEPNLTIDKIVPAQELAYTVRMDVYPSVKLGAWPEEKIAKKKPEVSKQEVEESLAELAKMLVREEPADRPAAPGDGAVVDFDVLVNGVPIEGGSAKDFSLVIGEGRMIPGFEDRLVGRKAGETADFKLQFPKDYKPELAGKEGEFKVTLKQVLQRTVPEIDDALAKRLGAADKADLLKKLEDNLADEKDQKELQRAEIQAVKKVVDAAEIGDIPAAMIKDEVRRLIHEFEHDLAHQGLNLQSYLGGAGKKPEDLEKEFEPKALERIKTSLVIDEIADREKLEVDEEEVDREWNQQKEYYSTQPQAKAEVERPEYRNQLRSRMLKMRAVDLIRSKLVS